MNRFALVLLVGVIFLAGCASIGSFPVDAVTQVNLEKNNYKIVAPNASGASSGFFLLGILPITSPQQTIAMSRLYESAGIKAGSSNALSNVVQEQTSVYLILFSIPTYRVRADVVQFMDTNESTKK